MQQYVSFAESHREWLMKTIEALVRLESPSTDKTAVDACGAELSRRLTAAGAEVERVPCATRGDHIRARFAGEGPQITLLGHFDTVWPLGQFSAPRAVGYSQSMSRPSAATVLPSPLPVLMLLTSATHEFTNVVRLAALIASEKR